MNIERHVFGSYKGYTTLAKSAGISTEDARQLEGGVYGFGQTEDRRYAKSLRTNPAYFTRVLRNGRRGLTRVFEGALDSDGRPTNVMITAIFANGDWDGKLYGDISHLLNDKQTWNWPGGSTIAAIDRTYPAPVTAISRKSAGKVIALIAEIERRWSTSAPIIVSSDEFGDEEIRAVEALIPPKNRPQFTSACRSLSPQLAVTLNQLAAEAPEQKTTYRYEPTAPQSPYTELLFLKGLMDGRLPIGDVLTYRNFGRVEQTKPAAKTRYSPPPMPIQNQHKNWIIWSAIAAAIVLVIVGGLLIMRSIHAAALAQNIVPQPTPTSLPPLKQKPNSDVTNGINTAVAHDANLKEAPGPSSDSPIVSPAQHSIPASKPAPPPKILGREADDPVLAMVHRKEAQADKITAELNDLLISTNQRPFMFDGDDGSAIVKFQKEARKYHIDNLNIETLANMRNRVIKVSKLLKARNYQKLEPELSALEQLIPPTQKILAAVIEETGNSQKQFFSEVDELIARCHKEMDDFHKNQSM